MKLGQSFRDHADTLLKNYSEEIGCKHTTTLEELIASHRERREMCIQLIGAWNKAYDAGYEEKWNFKIEWCRKAGFSPCNDLYWELAERAYAQRYFDCSPASGISQIPASKQNKGK